MADRGDQRDHARGRRAHHDLLVERPQILERAAAARDDEEIGPAESARRRQRVEAVDGGGDLARREPSPCTRTGQTSTWRGNRSASRCRMSRMTAPVGEVTTPITFRQERQQLLARRVEQALGGELLLALLEQRHERAEPGRLERLDHDLVFRLAGIGREPAGDDDFEPFLGLDAHAGERALPDHRLDLGALVLEREIAVAGGVRPAIAGDFAAHAHVSRRRPRRSFSAPPRARRRSIPVR